VNYDNSLVVIITVTCYSWAPSIGDHLFTCGANYLPPQSPTVVFQHFSKNDKQGWLTR